MKKSILLLIMSINSIMLHAQFPYLPGSSGNGSFMKYSGTALNYDFGSSRIGFLYSLQKDVQPNNNGTYGFPDTKLFSVNFGAAVNENTFTLYENGLKPGLDLSVGYSRTFESSREDSTCDNVSKQVFIRLVAQSKALKFLDDSTTPYTKNDNTNLDVGLNFGYSRLKEKPKEANGESYISVGGFAGYSFNSSGSLKEQDTYEQVSTSGSISIVKSEKRFIGKATDIFTTKIFFDWGKKLKSLNDQKYPASKANQKALYFLFRAAPEFPEVKSVKWNAFTGISINQYTNIVLGAILFEFSDFTNNAFKDSFAVRLYVGVPIKFK